MDAINQEIVDSIKNRIIRKSEAKPFMQTRLGLLLSTDWIELIIDRIAYNMYLKRQQEEQQGERQEIMEVLYVAEESKFIPNEENINDSPMMVEEDRDGNRYVTYPNNIVEIIKPKYVLTSIFPSVEVQNEVMDYLNYLDEIELDKRKKKLFSKYLGISEEEIELMTWESIDEAILNKYIRTHRWKRKILAGSLIANKE